MPFSGVQETRLGLYGGPRGLYGSFAGKALAPPVFTGTIPDISLDFDTGTHNYDYSSYFTGATSYSISPSVESGWSFNTSTCVLTVDTDDASIFGPFTITGTNVSGSDSSNAFLVTVQEAEEEAFTGGWWIVYEQEQEKRRKKRKELALLEEKAKKLQSKLDRELALEIAKEEQDRERLAELNRLALLADEHKEDIQELGERVTKAYQRAIIQFNYSALEALDREINRAKDEEDWLIKITLELLND